MSTVGERVTVDGNGVSRTYTSNGGEGNINSSEEYHNTGVAKVYTDQGNFEVYLKDHYMGCNGSTIVQTNGNRCEVTGGRSEIRCEGSRYTIVGDADTYFYHIAEQLDKLNAKIIAYRSGFNDDRNDIDPSKLIPSFNFNINDITNAVLNQTDNAVKLLEPPSAAGKGWAQHKYELRYD